MKTKIMYLIRNFEELISAFFISVTVLTVIVSVLLRYILNIGLVWSEELATTCFIWSVFVGAAACYKRKMHIGIDLLVKLLPTKLQQLTNTIVNLFMVILNSYIFYLSIIYVQASYRTPTLVLGVSSAYVSSSLVVSFGLMTMHAIRFLIIDIKSIFIKIKQKDNAYPTNI